MTKEEIEAAAKEQCSYCRDGHVPKLWLGERTHTVIKGTSVTHTLCRANQLWLRYDRGFVNGQS